MVLKIKVILNQDKTHLGALFTLKNLPYGNRKDVVLRGVVVGKVLNSKLIDDGVLLSEIEILPNYIDHIKSNSAAYPENAIHIYNDSSDVSTTALENGSVIEGFSSKLNMQVGRFSSEVLQRDREKSISSTKRWLFTE